MVGFAGIGGLDGGFFGAGLGVAQPDDAAFFVGRASRADPLLSFGVVGHASACFK